MNDNRGRAKHLLKYYLRMVARSSGVQWDSDNDAEVEEIVDCLIGAAVEEMQPQPMSRAEFVEVHSDTITRLT